MKKVCETILSILIALELTGCGAAQWAMPIDQSLEGMRAAVQGMPGTWAYTNAARPDWVILGWSTGSKYAFILVDQAGAVMKDLRNICALKCNWMSAADLLTWLEQHGWANVPAASLPPALCSQVGTLAYLISIGSRTLPSILIIPFSIPGDPGQLIRPEIGA